MLIIGHRGCNDEGYNQNTLRSFQKVMNEGVLAIEFDVQLSADGDLPIVHNLDLTQVSNGSGKVCSTSSSELRELYAGKMEQGRDRIPFLEDVFQLFASRSINSRPVMHLELKGQGTGIPSGMAITKAIDCGDLRLEDFLISSFNWKELDAIRSLCPGLKIALLDGAIRRENLQNRVPGSEIYYSDVFAYGEEDYMLPRYKTWGENMTLLEQFVPSGDVQEGLREEVRRSLYGEYYNETLIASAQERGAWSVNLWYLTVTSEFIEQAHQAGLNVYLYTINAPEDMLRAQEMGADGFFTDHYSLASQVLSTAR
ncbi:MAG: glycerophosphodiester phosphodiesterase [Spirochaetales bacterium]|nr:glycerophosphodiester phosphodiesterase [Spirochaetales bacterium]